MRYSGDTLGLLAIAVALIVREQIQPGRRLLETFLSGSPLDDVRRRSAARPVGAVVGALALVAFVGSSSVSTIRYRQDWDHTTAGNRIWLANLYRSARSAARGGPVDLLDAAAPAAVAARVRSPDDLDSYQLGTLGVAVSRNGTGTRVLTPDPTGLLVPAHLQVTASAGRGTLTALAGGDGEVAGSRCSEKAATPVTAPLAQAPGDPVQALRVSYSSAAPAVLVLEGMEGASAQFGDTLSVPAGTGTVIGDLPPFSYGSVAVVVHSPTQVCVSALEIGVAAPRP